jgi:hypothetical protein
VNPDQVEGGEEPSIVYAVCGTSNGVPWRGTLARDRCNSIRQIENSDGYRFEPPRLLLYMQTSPPPTTCSITSARDLSPANLRSLVSPVGPRPRPVVVIRENTQALHHACNVGNLTAGRS